jgi:hypothetical protein
MTLASCHYPPNLPVPRTPIPQYEGDQVSNAPTEMAPTQLAITPTPTVSSQPFQLTATVWEDLPQVPILMYHRFSPTGYSYSYTTSLADFEWQLNALYQAGFSLVSLSDWLRGDIQLQAGRRPLIITIDDLFYADQIFLDEGGNPAPYSGLGRLWQFAQAHPDFNFEVALFYNMGDKGYANYYNNGTFTIGDGWRQARARAIAWCVEHGAMPLNHFYEHPFLNQLSPPQIQYQLEENDKALREALGMVNRQDLCKTLPNILALPYVVAPETESGNQVLLNYINPEGAPVAGIMWGDYAGGAKFISAPFAHDFNRWHIPRISASNQAISTIVERADDIPSAASCDLGEFRGNPHVLPDAISDAILMRIRTGDCPYGYYVVKQLAFYVQEDVIIQYSP